MFHHGAHLTALQCSGRPHIEARWTGKAFLAWVFGIGHCYFHTDTQSPGGSTVKGDAKLHRSHTETHRYSGRAAIIKMPTLCPSDDSLHQYSEASNSYSIIVSSLILAICLSLSGRIIGQYDLPSSRPHLPFNSLPTQTVP
jgi:hypothetical protein